MSSGASRRHLARPCCPVKGTDQIMRFRRPLTVLAALTVLSAGLLVGPVAGAQAQVKTSTGKELLATLKVRPEHNTGYQRSKFTVWVDVDHDCQNTRSEVLQQESQVAVTFYSVKHCAVSTGRWVSWYDDATWTKASDVDIDHVVALAETWRSGAWTWSAAKRTRYANDLAFPWTLDAITDNVNSAKSDRDPAQWLPANSVCKYARHWVAIKYRWRLTIDPDEQAALAGILTGSCGDKKLAVPARGA
jgi:hypothetical protein